MSLTLSMCERSLMYLSNIETWNIIDSIYTRSARSTISYRQINLGDNLPLLQNLMT